MKRHSFQRPVTKSVYYGFLVVVLFACFASFVTAASMQQVKFNEDLFSGSFPNEEEGWASGRHGEILHTSDGGLTWEIQDSGVDYSLPCIYFLDTENGWAVGDEGTIVHTKDGGKTWEKQKSPVSFYLMGVFFVTPMQGWIVTERTHILKTDDGGQTWEIEFKDEDFILRCVSFADEIHGWAAGEYGYIYHTADGGKTWEHQAGFYRIAEEEYEIEGGKFIFDIEAVDRETVWATGIDGYVIKTENGGKSWQEIDVRLEGTTLFTVASDRKDAIVIGGDGCLVVSIDGGKNWQYPSLSPSIDYGGIYGLGCVGLSDFVAVGKEAAIYRPERGNPLKTWILQTSVLGHNY